MSKKVSILGCGWLGKPLALHLKNKQWDVKGSVRNPLNLPRISDIKGYTIDIDKNLGNFRDFLSSEILIISIPNKNILSFKKLIKKIEHSTIKKVLFISSTSVYPNTNTIVTEKTNTLPTALVDIENLLISSNKFETTIIRFGGLIGNDRHPGKFIDQKVPLKNPDGYINMIHIEDCIGIITKIIQKSIWGEIFNACSPYHPKRKEFYLQASNLLRKEILIDESLTSEYKIVDSSKLQKRIGHSFIVEKLIPEG